MPLSVPDLDDRRYADLLSAELDALAATAPEWTNRNGSDPGITLLELFAFVAESLLYRVNQVTDDHVRAFARLLRPEGDGSIAADEQLRDAIAWATTRERLVTCADFEEAAVADPDVVRAHCVTARDLTAPTKSGRAADRPGHVSVLIVPEKHAAAGVDHVLARVRESLEPRRLVGTIVHVGQPGYVRIGARLTITADRGVSTPVVRNRVVAALERFLDARTGGVDGAGWPLGRPIHVSEIYALLDAIPGVDYVSRTVDRAGGHPVDELIVEERERLVRGASPDSVNELASVRLDRHELPLAVVDPDAITVRPAGDVPEVVSKE